MITPGGCRCECGQRPPGGGGAGADPVDHGDGHRGGRRTVKTWAVEAQRSAAPPTDVCTRTPEVRDAIVTAVTAVTDCAAVTAAHLAGIGGQPGPERHEHRQPQGGRLYRADPADGAAPRREQSCIAACGPVRRHHLLTSLRLDGNILSSLPAGLFEPLTVLSDLACRAIWAAAVPAGRGSGAGPAGRDGRGVRAVGRAKPRRALGRERDLGMVADRRDRHRAFGHGPTRPHGAGAGDGGGSVLPTESDRAGRELRILRHGAGCGCTARARRRRWPRSR